MARQHRRYRRGSNRLPLAAAEPQIVRSRKPWVPHSIAGYGGTAKTMTTHRSVRQASNMADVDQEPALIRLATLHDTDAVRTVARDAYSPWIARFGREPSPMHDDYAHRIADGHLWVLEKDGALAGFVLLKESPDSLLVPSIAVAPIHQGKGHGRKLLAFAAQEARRRGYREVRLFVNTLMVENVAFYQHLGFTELFRINGESSNRCYSCLGKTVAP